jgi:GAF domain-containing protein
MEPHGMQPLPEIRSSLDRLSAQLGEGMDLARYLTSVAEIAQSLVPSCVAVSITIVMDGEPYTMTATAPQAHMVDAMQNLDGGPCIAAMDENETIMLGDVLDEDRWQFFEKAARSQGIRSSLSFPIRDLEDVVKGGMNLYATEPDAFQRDQHLIEVGFAADLSEAVTNADLSFMTRDFARELPERLEARERLDQAVGVLMALRGWDASVARSRLRHAASLAGADLDAVAEVVISLEPEAL